MHSNIKLPSALLILLWIYPGQDRIIRFEDSRKAFCNQTFSEELSKALSNIFPRAELLLALLLLFSVTRWSGYLISIFLLTMFIH